MKKIRMWLIDKLAGDDISVLINSRVTAHSDGSNLIVSPDNLITRNEFKNDFSSFVIGVETREHWKNGGVYN